MAQADAKASEGKWRAQAVASGKAEQKLDIRPTYPADAVTRAVLRSDNAANELVAKRMPETAPSCDCHALRSPLTNQQATSHPTAGWASLVR